MLAIVSFIGYLEFLLNLYSFSENKYFHLKRLWFGIVVISSPIQSYFVFFGARQVQMLNIVHIKSSNKSNRHQCLFFHDFLLFQGLGCKGCVFCILHFHAHQNSSLETTCNLRKLVHFECNFFVLIFVVRPINLNPLGELMLSFFNLMKVKIETTYKVIVVEYLRVSVN